MNEILSAVITAIVGALAASLGGLLLILKNKIKKFVNDKIIADKLIDFMKEVESTILKKDDKETYVLTKIQNFANDKGIKIDIAKLSSLIKSKIEEAKILNPRK